MDSISTAPGFGSDTRLYYRFQLANGFELAGRSSMAGTFTEILSPNTDYTLTLYRPADNRWAVYRGRSNASGQVTDLGTLILDQFGGPDTDGDGLPDAGEYALGTRPDSRDSDGDGLSDDAELTQGLNPNDGRSFPTGIIASLPLRGEAKEVVVEENLAYVATGSYGLAIVDVSRFDTPIILGQLDLPGDATDVGVDTALKLAAVVCGSAGLQLVDVSDPMQPRVVRTVPLPANRVEVSLSLAYVASGANLISVDLLTGDVVQNLTLPGATLTDVCQEGSFLYTMDSERSLRVVQSSNQLLTARGSLQLAEGAGRLFVGNGIGYVSALTSEAIRGGFSTVSVTNADAPVLIGGANPADGRVGRGIAANGSGLAVQVGTIFPTSLSARQPRLHVLDASNPTNTDNLLISFNLPAGPESVRIASGIAFVANGNNGLNVVNYRAFDNSGLAPGISLSASFPLAPAVVEAAMPVLVSANVSDDVQVRDVEFYLDGVLVGRDVSFPFEFRFVTPPLASFRLRAKATDTGGNVAWSSEILVTLLPSEAPLVVRTSPVNGSNGTNLSQLACYFNRPLLPSSVNASTFRLQSAGPDGVLGNANDVILTNGVISYRDEFSAAFMTFTPALAPGRYRATVAPPLAGSGGVPLPTAFTWDFEAFWSATVVGILRDSNGAPVPDITVKLISAVSLTNAAFQGVTASDGRFQIDGIPPNLWPFSVSVDLVTNGNRFVAASGRILPLPGVAMDAGILVLQAFHPPALTQLAVGNEFGVALKRGGTLWAWGANGDGQLGDGTGTNRTRPVAIAANRTWAAVSAASDSTIVLAIDGSLWGWGDNSYGNLGDGTQTTRFAPVPVATDKTWNVVSAGGHTMAVADDGTLWGWGYNGFGELGDGTLMDRSSPVQVATNGSWISVSVGGNHTLAIAADGTLWAWGYNNSGQLGNGMQVDQTSPIQVGFNKTWAMVSAGDAHSMAIATDGTLWAWGDNAFGKLGDGTGTDRTSPVPVGTNRTWVSVDAGIDHSTAVASDRTLWTWGRNNNWQLGDGTQTAQPSPVLVPGTNQWIASKAGWKHTIALAVDGTLSTWGDNSAGQLGDETRTARPIPKPVATNRLWSVVTPSLAIAADGTLWGWGPNGAGQLGDGTMMSRPTPVQVAPNRIWEAVSARSSFAFALATDETLWSWGANSFGQLGDGTQVDRVLPDLTATNQVWIRVSAGNNHSLGVADDGRLWGWGANTYGQLGDNSHTTRISPVLVVTSRTWDVARAGGNSSIAIASDGTLWAWGRNNNGQLGDGTRNDQMVPIPAGTNVTWADASLGGDLSRTHVLALTAGGALFGWGANNAGQLGDGTRTDRLVPVPLATNLVWQTVSAGVQHSLAVAANGTLWAWGRNLNGQLGDGTKTDRLAPVHVATNVTWIAVAAGLEHSIGLATDGTLWSWGLNTLGQLGDGRSPIVPAIINDDIDWGPAP